MNDVLASVLVVWGYDNENKVWKIYRPSVTETLTSIEAGKGYWIYMEDSAFLTVTGSAAVASVHLYEGWNLVGFAGTDGRAVTDSLSSIPGKWRVIWTWEDQTWSAKDSSIADLPVSALTNLSQGKAYWISIKSGQGECDWTQ